MDGWKALGHDFLLAELKIDGRVHPSVLERFHAIIVHVWRRRVSRRGAEAQISQRCTRIEPSRLQQIQRNLNGLARTISAPENNGPRQRLLRSLLGPMGGTLRLLTDRSTVDMMLVVRRLQR